MPDYYRYGSMVTFTYRLHLVISPSWDQLTRIHENRPVSALSLLTLGDVTVCRGIVRCIGCGRSPCLASCPYPLNSSTLRPQVSWLVDSAHPKGMAEPQLPSILYKQFCSATSLYSTPSKVATFQRGS